MFNLWQDIYIENIQLKEEYKTLVFDNEKFNKYIITESGLIYRLDKESKIKLEPLKPWDDQRGYDVVDCMNDKNQVVRMKIHDVVFETFNNKKDLLKKLKIKNAVIDHKDGNKKNNHRNNLELVSQRENVARAQQLIKNKNYLDKDTVKEIKKHLSKGKSIKEISEIHNIPIHVIYDINRGKTYNFTDK